MAGHKTRFKRKNCGHKKCFVDEVTMDACGLPSAKLKPTL